jgi:large subunit ribosomal protein L23
MIMPYKTRRRGRIVGRLPAWKKAVVTLREGDRIELFEGV